MLKKLNWQAFSNKERNAIIDQVKEIISDHGGYILNFNRFSDLALSLTIEIEERHIPGLYEALIQIIRIIEPAPEDLKPSSEKEWWIFFNISFSQGKGKLEVEVPSVPG